MDPTKVTRSALQNAASIAALMLTTEAMITNIKEDDEGKPPGSKARSAERQTPLSVRNPNGDWLRLHPVGAGPRLD